MDGQVVFDLHTHSTASDGELSPTELYQRARSNGVGYLALTDHDTLDGVREIEQYIMQNGSMASTQLIPGVEVTAQVDALCVHVLGLWVACENDTLNHFLRQQQAVRDIRGEDIARALEKKTGITDAYSGAKKLADGAALARPHFARMLVEKSVCKSVQDAFNRYLGKGKVGDVKCDWPALGPVVEIIHAAGGKAVLAHPEKYSLSKTRLRDLLDHFAASGGDGIELVSGAQPADSSAYLARLADQRGLAGSTGSDFHSPDQVWCDLGKQPQMPDCANTIWY